LSYVVLLHPHTSGQVFAQLTGKFRHVPWELWHCPVGRWQNSPGWHELLPQRMHSPAYWTDTPTCAASHALLYVWASQPQTGSTTAGQMNGLGWQVPTGSSEKQTPGGNAQ
jgi:hypothetical protein